MVSISTHDRLNAHWKEAMQYFPEDRVVALCLQGSQNYTLETELSDVDSKLIVVPTFDDLVFNRKPVSTTHVRENDEHIDFKDIRLYMDTFRKGNPNFVEILFTPFYFLNTDYLMDWSKLVMNREKIARRNIFLSVKAMTGVCMEKYHAMEHRYPSRAEIIDKYGYDGKQLHHLVRMAEFIERYLAGYTYESCLIPNDRNFLISLKKNELPLAEARLLADKTIEKVRKMVEPVTKDSEYNKTNSEVDDLLNSVQSSIMEKAILRRRDTNG